MAITMMAAHGTSTAGPKQAGGEEIGEKSGDTEIARLPENHVDLGGRWRGEHSSHGVVTPQGDCTGGACELVYDIVACGDGWCGTRVGADGTCGSAMMTLTAREPEGPAAAFEGQLHLSAEASPYTVRAWFQSGTDQAKIKQITMSGDTGGELMMFRRSFPFHARLVRAGKAVCGVKNPVS